ncbi:hypothetical protein [Verminephrobacter aporrectodeae]|nr:hypothetical protein [Verminephrobacter aporrectodeae]
MILPDTAHKADEEQGDFMVLKSSAEATVAPAAKAEEQVLNDDQSSTDSESKVAQDTDHDKADEAQDDSMVLKSSAEATAAPAAKAEEQVLADDQSSAASESKVAQDTDDNWNGDKGYAKVDDRDGNCYGDDYSNGDYNWDYNWDGNCDDASGAAEQPLLIVGRASDAESFWF